MNLYHVTASNFAFWQTLAVTAENPAQALQRAEAHLAEPSNQHCEEEEFEMAQQHYREQAEWLGEDDADLLPAPTTRDDVRYGASEADVELIDEDAPEAPVTLLKSGGNG